MATMDRDMLLAAIKRRLQAAWGERLVQVVLYGSEARGEAGPDSDIDVMVVLQGPFDYWKAIRTNIDVLYDLVLEIERPIDAQVVDVAVFEAGQNPIYRNVKREGIVA